MQKKVYNLHSICVHDGNASSGHYFSFIYDRFDKKWRKYNDITVSEVSEDQVFAESVGGDSLQTAYWLVYIQESLSNDKTNINLYPGPKSLNPYKMAQFPKGTYGYYIPKDILYIVEKENVQMANEVVEVEN